MPLLRPTNLFITFDAFGTLFTPRLPIAAQYALVAAKHGLVGAEEGTLQEAFKKALKMESVRNPNYGKSSGMRPEEWWTNVVTNTFKTITSSPLPPKLVPALIDRFASKAGYELYSDVLPLLRFLRRPGIWPYETTTIGVITNSDPRVVSVLDSLGVGVRSYHPTGPNHREVKEQGNREKPLLDFVTTSYDVGWEKPGIEIFNTAREIGHEKTSSSSDGSWRYVHVGDDPVKDYEAAELAGWKGILIDRTGESERPDKTVVKGLKDVILILVD